MAVTEARVAQIERNVAAMEKDAKEHFVELRAFIGDQIRQLREEFGGLRAQVEGRLEAVEGRLEAVEGRLEAIDRKLNWIVIPALTTIAASLAWMAVALSGLR